MKHSEALTHWVIMASRVELRLLLVPTLGRPTKTDENVKVSIRRLRPHIRNSVHYIQHLIVASGTIFASINYYPRLYIVIKINLRTP